MNVFKAMESPIAFFISQVVFRKCKQAFRCLRKLTIFNCFRSFENERNAEKICYFISKE